jgi:hypothetical protein
MSEQIARLSVGRVDQARAFDKSQLRLLDRFNAMSGNHRRLVTLLFKALAEGAK